MMQNRGLYREVFKKIRGVFGNRFGAPNFSIIVFQMGKVGSKTVQESLVRAYKKLHQPVDVHHSHILCNFVNAETIIRKERPNPEPTLAVINAGRELRKQIDYFSEHQWKIVTLVRDPVARNVGTFFQVLDEHIPNWAHKHASNTLKVDEIQKAFLSAGSIHSEPVRWFDEQLLPVFGVDVFAETFPKETGYKIYNPNSKTPVLLIRLEDLNRVGSLAMKEFLDLDNFELYNVNIGEEKEYAELYRLFKQNPLPIEYIQAMYNTKYAQTFYTDSDIAEFSIKWEGDKKNSSLVSGIKYDPIIVYQMGKVGSKTVEHSLRHFYQSQGIDVEIYHAHFLNYLKEMEKSAIKRRNSKQGIQHIHEMMALKKEYDGSTSRKWKLISLVRDPVARNIASFFQGLSVNQFIPNWKSEYKKGNLGVKELQEKFLSLGDDYHSYPAHWFDTQLMPIFKIDVYDKPFPFEQGFKIYNGNARADLLVIRMEDLNRCSAQAMYDYLNIVNFKLLISNISEEKDYQELYNSFKKQPLPAEYVENIYTTKYAHQFYDQKELVFLKQRWTGC